MSFKIKLIYGCIHSFTQPQTLLEHLLCARYCARCWRHKVSKINEVPAFTGLGVLKVRQTLMKLSHTQLTLDHDKCHEGNAQGAMRAHSKVTWSYREGSGTESQNKRHYSGWGILLCSLILHLVCSYYCIYHGILLFSLSTTNLWTFWKLAKHLIPRACYKPGT